MIPAEVPAPGADEFYSMTRTASGISIVCAAASAPAGSEVERGWRGMRLDGPIPFSVTGVLASLATPLAAAGVPVFAISTYDTDYLLVRHADGPRAQEVLESAGFLFPNEGEGAGEA